MASSLAFAQVPAKLAYQGRLFNADGTPVTGVRALAFALYSTPSGGSPLWSETQQVAFSEGFYSTLLGDATDGGVPQGLLDGSELFLEVSVGNEILSPRQRVDSVAYALKATDSASLGGTPASGYQLRVSGTCPNGSYLSGVNPDGTVACAAGSPGTVTGITAGPGLSGGGSSGNVTLSNSGVLTVGASGALSSSGGQNPTVSLSGVVGISNGGTGTASAPTAAGQFLRSTGAGAWDVGNIAATDLPPLSGSYVDLGSNQTVGGTKTFSSPIVGDITGNAGTVTNGLYANASYADPAWLASLAGSKIAGPVANATTAVNFSGGLGGDVTGAQGATTVGKIQGQAIAAATPSDGQVLKFSQAAGQWQPQADLNSGGTVTNVTASSPLSVANGSSTPNVSMTQAGSSSDGWLSSADWSAFNGKQARVTGSCAVGSYISSVNADGTVVCAAAGAVAGKPHRSQYSLTSTYPPGVGPGPLFDFSFQDGEAGSIELTVFVMDANGYGEGSGLYNAFVHHARIEYAKYGSLRGNGQTCVLYQKTDTGVANQGTLGTLSLSTVVSSSTLGTCRVSFSDTGPNPFVVTARITHDYSGSTDFTSIVSDSAGAVVTQVSP